MGPVWNGPYTQPYSVTVYPEGTILVNGHLMPPLAITTASYQMNAVTGVPFSVKLAATGGAFANYTFALSNMGALSPRTGGGGRWQNHPRHPHGHRHLQFYGYSH